MMNNTEYMGLSENEVSCRISEGLVNGGSQVSAKSVKDIIRTNTLTFFNLINVVLAAAVIAVGSFESVLFMFVVIWNTLIGIVQEIRAKLITDRLSLISRPKAFVIRGGREETIDYKEIVLDDLLRITAGMQICADCEVVDGECEANESLISGESDTLTKGAGDALLSGSFVVSGEVLAKTVRVGADNFTGRITKGVNFIKKPGSKMFRSMDRIVKGISVCILPIMLLLFYRSVFTLNEPLKEAIISVVAAVIGMIPEGLVLLISIVMAVSSLRLARNNALVQDMYCIETLARVDALCLDKTGTITKGDMQVECSVLLDNQATDEEVFGALGALSLALPDINPTANAIRKGFGNKGYLWQPEKVYPFSGSKKWSGAYFKEHGSCVMGAADFILKDGISDSLKHEIEQHAGKGKRVILFARSNAPFNDRELPSGLKPAALIIINDVIRDEAPETLKFFADNNVEIKIISGDDVATVRNIAEKAGIKSAGKVIDMSGADDEDIPRIAVEYTIFGRVSPYQKLGIINALKRSGHTVGMVGDGVNDVLALKHADCSVAMQSGSDAARNVSDIVLLDSNFDSMPKIVKEGRRSINNIERSSALFLTKTVFSLVVGIAYIFIDKPYPLLPIQMTLINALFIGIPSFLLALEPNTDIVKGSFIENALKKAIPFGFCNIVCILSMTALAHLYELTSMEIRSIAAIIVGITSFLVLCRICVPFTKLRVFMTIMLGAVFAVAVQGLDDFLQFTDFSLPMLLITASLTLISVSAVWYFPVIGESVIKKYKSLKRNKKSGKI